LKLGRQEKIKKRTEEGGKLKTRNTDRHKERNKEWK
jgi:hypothetical protein